MSYAIIAGVIFAWIVTLLWAGKEIADARRSKRVLSLKDAHDSFWGAFK